MNGIAEFAQRELGLFLSLLVAVGLYTGILIDHYWKIVVFGHPELLALLLLVVIVIIIVKIVQTKKLVHKQNGE